MLIASCSLSYTDFTTNDDVAVLKNQVTLLELPWDVKTIPFLLDLLKESGDLVSPSGWKQLRVRLMIGNALEMTNKLTCYCLWIT